MHIRSIIARRGVAAAGLLLLALLMMLPSLTAAQPDTLWVRSFGTEGENIAKDIEVVDDGILVIGTKAAMDDNPPYPQLWLIKVDYDGNLLWEREYGDNGIQIGNSLAPTADGGFILSGSNWSGGKPNAYLIKTDALGNVQWERTYSSDYESIARDVEPTPDGGFAVTGGAERVGINDRVQLDAFILKTDADGNPEWFNYYGGGWEKDETWSIEVLDDGYAIAGRTWSGGVEMRDAVIAKVDLDGNYLWHITRGGENKDHIYEFQALDDGSFIATGKTESFGNGGLGRGDIWVLRYDANGDFLWETWIGPYSTDFGRSIEIMDNGDYVITGLTLADGLGNQAFVGRLDPQGNWLWTQSYGLQGRDDAWSVRKLPDGDVVVGGHTENYGDAPKNLLLFRLDLTD